MQGYSVRSTACGLVRGVAHNRVESYLGIPYGASTGGAARWRTATAPEAWTGIRDATAFGAVAPQVDSRLGATGSWPEVLDLMYPRGGSPAEGGHVGEDCLVLNVWAPAERDSEALPVMVWFHGGGYGHGAGSEMLFSGDELARTGRVIVVSINHRLGLMGFLALDHVLGSSFRHSGQAGITDLVLALTWVRENIAGFGGDPERVTIFGQSGGAAKVSAMLAMPSARGLFQRAVMQSGPVGWFATRQESLDRTARVLGLLGLDASEADLLLDLPLRYLLAAQRRAQAAAITWAPHVDGDLVPALPFSAEGIAAMPQVPLLVGSAAHEMSLMLTEQLGYDTLQIADLGPLVATMFPERHDEVIADYRSRFPGENASLVLARIATDATFTRSTTLAAAVKSRQPAPVYAYRLDYETDAHGGRLGATHSLDLPLVFGTVARSPFAGSRKERFDVSRRMRDAWLAFAECGAPNHDDIPAWPAYDEAERRVMVIDSQWSVVEGPRLDGFPPVNAPLAWPDQP